MNKLYKYNDSFYFFNHNVFNDLFIKRCKKEKIRITRMEEQLANAINVSRETVHGWRCNIYSPNDLNLIIDIANFFNCDKKMFLNNKVGDVDMKKISDVELMSIKRVYESIIKFLEYFYKTDGFNDLWFNFKKMESSEKVDKLYEVAENEHSKVVLSLKIEYPIIGKNKIYEDLNNFIYNDLYDIFDGKLTYAYRFEAMAEGNPTTDEDYIKAYKKINEIIDSYCSLS